jgi:SAM-dependent methyltransferase
VRFALERLPENVNGALASDRFFVNPPNMLKRMSILIQRLAMDLRYGGFTGGERETRFAHLGANETVSTDYALLNPLLAGEMRPGEHFVDVGCGTGRVLNWVLADGRAKKIYGLELDGEVAAATAKRLKKRSHVAIVAGDAVENLPDDATLLYLWNPFQRDVMVRFRDACINRFTAAGSLDRVRVVYHNCLHADVWQSHPSCRVEEIALPADARHRAIRVRFLTS